MSSEPVLMIGMLHTRCLAAASERLQAAGACFKLESWTSADDPLWKYMQCLHPHELVNGMMMHSYVYLGGTYVGNGFALLEDAMAEAELTQKLQVAHARLDCGRQCENLAPQSERDGLARMLEQPLALLGWSGCPCTTIARSRFESVGACYVQQVWPDDSAPLYKYLQCVHGAHHHSFVFFGGKFAGDGFALQEDKLDQPRFASKVDAVGASKMCQRKGDENLRSQPLQSCTQSNDGSTTGWARTGSCNWDPSDSGYHEVRVRVRVRVRIRVRVRVRVRVMDPSDSGYHEVCVTMSEEFLLPTSYVLLPTSYVLRPTSYVLRPTSYRCASPCRKSSCASRRSTTRMTSHQWCRPAATGASARGRGPRPCSATLPTMRASRSTASAPT